MEIAASAAKHPIRSTITLAAGAGTAYAVWSFTGWPYLTGFITAQVAIAVLRATWTAMPADPILRKILAEHLVKDTKGRIPLYHVRPSAVRRIALRKIERDNLDCLQLLIAHLLLHEINNRDHKELCQIIATKDPEWATTWQAFPSSDGCKKRLWTLAESKGGWADPEIKTTDVINPTLWKAIRSHHISTDEAKRLFLEPLRNYALYAGIGGFIASGVVTRLLVPGGISDPWGVINGGLGLVAGSAAFSIYEGRRNGRYPRRYGKKDLEQALDAGLKQVSYVRYADLTADGQQSVSQLIATWPSDRTTPSTLQAVRGAGVWDALADQVVD